MKKMRRTVIDSKRIALLAAGLASSVVVSMAASAEDARVWSMDAGLEHSDNIRRTDEGSASDTIAQAGLAITFNNKRPRLDTQIGADLKYWSYLDNTYKDEVVGGFNGGLTYSFKPERFTWMVHDNFGQVAADPRSTVTAGNRRNVNFLTTGPDLTLPLGSVNALVMSGRYSRVNYDSPNDTTIDPNVNGGNGENNTKYMGSLGLVHRLSDEMSVSLNGSTTRTQYEDNSALIVNAQDYDVREASVGFNAKGIRTTLATRLGWTQLRFDNESHSGLLASVALSRKIGTRSTLAAEVGTQYADTADTFAQGQVFRGVNSNTSDATASNDPFKSDYLNVSWVLIGARSTMTFALFTRKEKHEHEQDLDRKVQTLSADVSRRLGPRVTLTANGQYVRDRFQNTPDIITNQNVDLDYWSAGAGIQWLLGRSLGAQLRFDRQTGSGTGASRTYTENRVFAGITFTSGTSGR